MLELVGPETRNTTKRGGWEYLTDNLPSSFGIISTILTKRAKMTASLYTAGPISIL